MECRSLHLSKTKKQMRRFKFFQNLKKFSFLDVPVHTIEPLPQIGNYHRLLKETVITDNMINTMDDDFLEHIKRVQTSEITNRLIEEGYFKFDMYIDDMGQRRLRCSIKVAPENNSIE